MRRPKNEANLTFWEMSSVLAMPKSISFTTPAALMWTFSGLMSRWMILAW